MGMRLNEILTASLFITHFDRDLKPENILYRSRDQKSDIVIADFGMCVFSVFPDMQTVLFP
jgi:hypothetical protein